MANNNKQKLELTWIGKNTASNTEPRVLLYDKEKSYGDQNTGNMLIHGDNLLALKALEQDYAGQVKCIYIDPPYNTGAAFEHYDDNLEHSIWLNLMRSRIELLFKLLADEGMIFIQLDDTEMAYLKIVCDEVFGRNNYLNTISVKAKSGAGASGGGEDKRLKKNFEFILIYAKNYTKLQYNSPMYQKNLMDYISEHKQNKVGFYYTRIITNYGSRTLLGEIEAGNGEPISVYQHNDFEFSSVSKIAKKENISQEEVYKKYLKDIFMVTNAQTSILTRVNSFVNEKGQLISYEYVPRTGKKKNTLDCKFVWNETLVVWLHDSAKVIDNRVVKLEKMGTLWTDISWGRLDLEGDVKFKSGKKPEALIKRILEIATEPGDIVLDSFLGSGTTAAVAHKMGRKYIGIESGEHCDTHCNLRLQRIIDGDQSGISKSLNWTGGGGFKYYELAPSLIKTDIFGNEVIDDSVYNADLLAQAIAKINGYKYNPDKTVYWKQGSCTKNSYIFTTMEYITAEHLNKISDELGSSDVLLICCPAFEPELDKKYESIDLKKIPQSLLGRYEYGKENYSLNIVDLPEREELSEEGELEGIEDDED